MKNESQIPTPNLQKYLEKFFLISTLLLSSALPVLANNPNLPPKTENSTTENSIIEPNSEKCNFPTKNENIYEITRIIWGIYDLGKDNPLEYNKRIQKISEKSDNLKFFINTECSQEMNQKILEKIGRDPFIQSVID